MNYKQELISISKITSGYVSLMMVLVMTAIVTLLIASATQSGIISSRTTTNAEVGQQALYNAEICAEEALERIRQTNSYTTDFSLTLDVGSCSSDISGGGSNKVIIASGMVGDNVETISVSTDSLSPIITVDEWQESN